MTQEERLMERYGEGVRAMSVDERGAFLDALRAARALPELADQREMLEALQYIGAARGRTERRRRSDKATDRKRRKLIGARVPIEMAKACQECADRTGVSLYRWVLDALQQAIQDTW